MEEASDALDYSPVMRAALAARNLSESSIRVLLTTMATDTKSAIYTVGDKIEQAMSQSRVASMKARRRIDVHGVFSSRDRNLMNTKYPHINIVYKEDQTRTHGLAAADRRIQTELLMSRVARCERIKDVGGNIAMHVKRGHLNVHICAPELNTRDQARHQNSHCEVMVKCERVTSDLAQGRKVNSRVLRCLERYVATDVGTEGADYFCKTKSEDCDVRADALIFIDSAYDIPKENIAIMMDRSGATRAYGSLVLHTDMLFNNEGHLADFDCDYNIDTKEDIVEYHYGRTQSAYGYSHKWSQLRQYLTNTTLITPYAAYYYGIEYSNQSTMTFSVRRIYNRPYELSAPVAHEMNARKPRVRITTLELKGILEPGVTNVLRTKIIEIPESIYEMSLAWAASRAADKSMDVNDIIRYITSINSFVIINGQYMRAEEKIRADDIQSLAYAIFVLAYRAVVRHNEMKHHLISLEDKRRVLSSWTAVMNLIASYTFGKLNAIKRNAITNLIERLRDDDKLVKVTKVPNVFIDLEAPTVISVIHTFGSRINEEEFIESSRTLPNVPVLRDSVAVNDSTTSLLRTILDTFGHELPQTDRAKLSYHLNSRELFVKNEQINRLTAPEDLESEESQSTVPVSMDTFIDGENTIPGEQLGGVVDTVADTQMLLFDRGTIRDSMDPDGEVVPIEQVALLSTAKYIPIVTPKLPKLTVRAKIEDEKIAANCTIITDYLYYLHSMQRAVNTNVSHACLRTLNRDGEPDVKKLDKWRDEYDNPNYIHFSADGEISGSLQKITSVYSYGYDFVRGKLVKMYIDQVGTSTIAATSVSRHSVKAQVDRPCTLFVNDHLKIYNYGALIYECASILNSENPWLHTKFVLINGVPGCGKTTWLLNTADSTDLITTATKAGCLEVMEKRKFKDAESEGLTLRPVNQTVRTLDSYGIWGGMQSDVLYVDEGLMVHGGAVVIAASRAKASHAFVTGDKMQIPFISRCNYKPVNFSLAYDEIINRNESYRCPIDVVTALYRMYDRRIRTYSMIRTSFSIHTYTHPPPLGTGFVALTFTQAEKYALMTVGWHDLAKKENKDYANAYDGVCTVHQAQGSTFKNVYLVRSNTYTDDIYDSQYHIVTAISRHTHVLEYWTVNSSDRTCQVIRSGNDEEIQRAVQSVS